MAKYIDADKLKDAWLSGIYIPPRCGKTLNSLIASVVTFIDDIPAADVVEVVRCKDCMHRYKDAEWRMRCKKSWYMECDNDNYFCSYGERKADNG